MKTLLFNINSTSWFYTFKNGNILKLEVYYIIICITAIIGEIGLAYDVIRGISFSNTYQILLIPFLFYIIEYLLYSLYRQFTGVVSKKIQDKFWKTQLWRFRDSSKSLQKGLYPDWKTRQNLIERMWEIEYGETPDETLYDTPWLQKKRIILLIAPALIIGIFVAIIKGIL